MQITSWIFKKNPNPSRTPLTGLKDVYFFKSEGQKSRDTVPLIVHYMLHMTCTFLACHHLWRTDFMQHGEFHSFLCIISIFTICIFLKNILAKVYHVTIVLLHVLNTCLLITSAMVFFMSYRLKEIENRDWLCCNTTGKCGGRSSGTELPFPPKNQKGHIS